MLADDQGQSHHRVLVHPDQATGLPHPTTLLQVLEDRERFLFGELAAVQGCALALAEAFLAGPAGQNTAFLVGAIAKADAEVVEAAAAVVGAVRVLAAEGFQVVQGGPWRSQAREKVAKQLESA